MKKIHLFLRLVVVLALALLLYSCAINPVTGKRQLMFVSEEKELAIGQESNPQILATMGLYEDKKLQAFIDKKGNEMARISHRPNLKYKFQIVNSPIVNAFAVPGGFVYFTRGIMAHFNSEAEFMGVLGHELGHITARHSAVQQTHQILRQGVLFGGMILVPELQKYGNQLAAGMQLLALKHSRGDEAQSDKLGVEYSTKVGYDAHKMAGFFQVLKRLQLRDNPSGIPTYLSSHPDPSNRTIAVEKDATIWQQKLKNKDFKVGRNRYLRMIDGIIFGDDPREGYVENGVFYHPKMRFKYPVPKSWQLTNSPQQVQMIAEGGKAMLLFALAGKDDLQGTAKKVLSGMNLKRIDTKYTKINGFKAMQTKAVKVEAAQNSQTKESLKVLSTFIKDGSTIFVFHGIATPEVFATYFSDFERTARGYARVRKSVRLKTTPDRIRVKTVRRTTTVASALRSLGVKRADLNTIAILNNMKLSDQIKAGTLIKIVGK